MEIFISWHGKRSHAVAVALRSWLPQIVNAFKPWLSSASIDKGARWSPEIATKLAAAKAGIFCLTPSNLAAPWILFEAGAISKTAENTHVCTLLVDLQPSDVTDPLAQFQATKLTKDDLLQLVKNLNGALGEDRMSDAHVEKAFDKWWPDLENELKKLPPDEASPGPRRGERDLLEELVEKVREMSNRLHIILPLQPLVPGVAPGVPIAFRSTSGPLNTLPSAADTSELIEAALRYSKDPEGAFQDFQGTARSITEKIRQNEKQIRKAALALGKGAMEASGRATQTGKPPQPNKKSDKGEH